MILCLRAQLNWILKVLEAVEQMWGEALSGNSSVATPGRDRGRLQFQNGMGQQGAVFHPPPPQSFSFVNLFFLKLAEISNPSKERKER